MLKDAAGGARKRGRAQHLAGAAHMDAFQNQNNLQSVAALMGVHKETVKRSRKCVAMACVEHGTQEVQKLSAECDSLAPVV